jgi:hypothetical protein
VRRHEPLPSDFRHEPPAGIASRTAAGIASRAVAPGVASSDPTPVLTRGPYLQKGGPDRVVIRWRTDVACDSRVQYAKVSYLPVTVNVPGDVTDHEVVLTGLEPATRYTYSVGTTCCASGGTTLASSSWVTASVPGSPGPTRLWIIGDSGEGDADEMAVRDAFLAWNGAHALDAFLMLGDNAYLEGTDTDYQNAVFNMFPTLLSQHVVWPTRGNHDLLYTPPQGDYYSIFSMPTLGECGGMPSASEAYYSFEIANIHIVCLDSEGSDRSRSGPMMRWLESDLAASTQPWTIAFWHHPPYSHGSHNSDDALDSDGRLKDMREIANGILDSAGVDVVLTGHSHSYERSYLLRGHYGDSSTLTSAMKVDSLTGRIGGTGPYHKYGEGRTPLDGIVYAVTGTGSSFHFGPLDHPVMISSRLSLGSMVVDVNGLRLDARFIDDHGAVLDSFAIFKGAALVVRPASGVADPAPRLQSIAPNPMRASASIGYVLPRSGETRLSIVDLAGRRVRLLHDAVEPAGSHAIVWDGRADSGARVRPGVYFARLSTGAARVSARLAVIE